jgi:dihydrolipoamide dehydrogenase
MKNCEVLVIGGGPGGYVAAIKAAQLGKKVTLIEKENLGGTCLNWGCIPMKSLLKNAEVIGMLRHGDEFGFETIGLKVHYSKAQLRSRKISERLSQGVSYLMKKNNINVIIDEAKIRRDKVVQLKKADDRVQAENIIIAAGAQPARLPILDYSNSKILDSRRALALEQVPESVCIIGGGAIGLEFASLWNAFGTKVTILEMMDRLLPQEDIDISEAVKKIYIQNGIEVFTSTTVNGIDFDNDKITVRTNSKVVESQYLLVSVGIKPISIGEEAQLKTDSKGFIVVDDAMRTNIEGIYAIGDVTGKLALAHTASAQGIIAAKSIARIETHPLDYDLIPRCTYGIIETASVGLTEQKAKLQNLDYITASFPLSANGKALTMGSQDGFAKIIAGRKHKELLGVSMVGSHVTEIISGAAGLINLEATLDEMVQTIYPHPTVSESLFEVAHAAMGEGIHF